MTTLSIGLLERFDETLCEVGASVVDAWLPGLSEDEIRSAFADLDGFELPQELVTWWQWHGDVDRALSPNKFFASSKGFFSPQEAARWHHPPDEPGAPPHLLSWINSQDPWLYASCAAPAGELAELYFRHKGELTERSPDSLGDLVTHWIAFIERGVWTCEPGTPWEWQYHYERLEDSENNDPFTTART